ncbi:arylamine N-acetyltransferase [Streptomyces gamaensis]|uniref:Arylamine N-acetyltransferase n=1 Tax=Streptomyces gamaensis TaxID=1763542 RepID=A0ABW0YYD0_9ACTN
MAGPSGSLWGGEQLDLAAYLARVGYEGERVPTPEVLSALQAAHIASMSWENLEVVLGRTVRLDLESLQEKMVRRRRGGTCSEQTLLYAAALEAIGFTFTATQSRVRLGVDKIRPATHASLRVELDGEVWLTDVGFGAEGLLAPLRLREGEVARQGSWTYGLVRGEAPTPGTAGPLVLRQLRADGWFDLYAMGTEPRFPVDFTMTNHFTSTHPRSPLNDKLLVQKTAPERRLTLYNTDLITVLPDFTVDKHQVTAEELPGLLVREFGVELSAEDADALVARYR